MLLSVCSEDGDWSDDEDDEDDDGTDEVWINGEATDFTLGDIWSRSFVPL